MKTWQVSIVAGVLAGVTIFGSLSASANPYNSYVDQRQINQEQRIQQAWQSGQLTPGEYRRLEGRQQQIRMIEDRMRADGRLDPAEKTRLNQMLNHSERAINHSTYNKQGFYRAKCRPSHNRLNQGY
jgi:anti-sigma factor RsiW